MGQVALGCHLSLNHQSIKNNKVNGNPHPLLILTPHFLFSLPLNFFYNFSRWRRWWPRAETTSSPTNHTRQTKNTQPNFPPEFEYGFKELKRASTRLGHTTRIPLYPPNFDENARCGYHDGSPGHTTDNCMTLKYKVQELVGVKYFQIARIECEEQTISRTFWSFY